MSEEYPCFTVVEMAAIPEEVLPDFLAELPALIRHTRQIVLAADDLAVEMKAKAPWPWRLLPVAAFATVARSGVKRASFTNDKKRTITLSARIKDGDPAFYRRTEQLDA